MNNRNRYIWINTRIERRHYHGISFFTNRREEWVRVINVVHSHVSDAGKNEEQPDVNGEDLKQLKEEFAADIPTQIQSTIDDDQKKLNQKNNEESHGNLRKPSLSWSFRRRWSIWPCSPWSSERHCCLPHVPKRNTRTDIPSVQETRRGRMSN